jgi:hypothetical protein
MSTKNDIDDLDRDKLLLFPRSDIRQRLALAEVSSACVSVKTRQKAKDRIDRRQDVRESSAAYL